MIVAPGRVWPFADAAQTSESAATRFFKTRRPGAVERTADLSRKAGGDTAGLETCATPMYDKILVTLDATPSDRAIIEHVKPLAKWANSRVVLLHVADGWAARTYGPDAISAEITEDTAYLEKIRGEFQSAGIDAAAELAFGEPGDEIVKWVEKKGCDLVAMSTHGHGFLADLFLGSASRRVRHRIRVPVLLLRAR